MNAFHACLACNLNQAIKIGELLQLNDEIKEQLIRKTLHFLAEADYNLSSPELMLGTWRQITAEINNDDPYKETKLYYNRVLLGLEPVIHSRIVGSPDPFKMAIELAIAGNLIDFAPGHTISEQDIEKCLQNVEKNAIQNRHIECLKKYLNQAKRLLYLGDNCGEIVLDKICIYYLKKWFPELEVTFVVRGGSILNDVTLEDASMVGMQLHADVIDNGDQSLGTVYERTGAAFRERFQAADVIIAKGQGNFEGLYGSEKQALFFLFMAKCEPIAQLIGVKKGAIVCLQNPYEV